MAEIRSDNRTVIYGLISPSGKIYIGQTWNLNDRLRHYKKLRCQKQRLLFNSLVKYGFDSHELKIMAELPKDVSQKTLDAYEQLYMDFYKDAGFILLNLKEAGNYGKHCDESKIKMSQFVKTDKQRCVSRINIAKAQQKPRSEKQLEVWRKWGTHQPHTDKQIQARLNNLEKGRKRIHTDREREISRKLMFELSKRPKTEAQIQAMKQRGYNAGKLPRTEKQKEASRQTLIKMHEKRRALKLEK